MGPLFRSGGGTLYIGAVTPIYWSCTNFLKNPIEFFCKPLSVFLLGDEALVHCVAQRDFGGLDVRRRDFSNC